MLNRYWLPFALLMLPGCSETPNTEGSAWYLSFSPDSNYLLATGIFEKTYETQIFECTPQGELTPITSFSTMGGNAEWSHDSQQIFFLNTEHSRINLFDMKQKAVIEGCHFKWPAGLINYLSDNFLVIAPFLIAEFEPASESPVVMSAFCPEGHVRMSEFGGCDSGTVFVVSVSRINGGPVATSYMGDCPVEIWDFQNEKMVMRYRLPQLTECWVKVSPDGQRMAALGAEGLTVWKLGQQEPERLFEFKEESVPANDIRLDAALQTRLSFSQNGERLAVCFNQEVQAIDIPTKKIAFTQHFDRLEEVVSCSISSDGSTLAISGNDGMGIHVHKIMD